MQHPMEHPEPIQGSQHSNVTAPSCKSILDHRLQCPEIDVCLCQTVCPAGNSQIAQCPHRGVSIRQFRFLPLPDSFCNVRIFLLIAFIPDRCQKFFYRLIFITQCDLIRRIHGIEPEHQFRQKVLFLCPVLVDVIDILKYITSVIQSLLPFGFQLEYPVCIGFLDVECLTHVLGYWNQRLGQLPFLGKFLISIKNCHFFLSLLSRWMHGKYSVFLTGFSFCFPTKFLCFL